MSIHEACLGGDVSKVKDLLSGGVDVNHLDSDSWSPLHCACAASVGSLECVEILLQQPGIQRDIKDSNGRTPLFLAGLKSNISCVILLLKVGADVNSVDNEHSTLLHKACFAGNKELVATLLKVKNIKLDSEDCHASTPLHLAVEYGSSTIVQLLLKKGVDINAQDGDGQTPLHIAVYQNHTRIVKMLLNHGVKTIILDEEGTSPFHLAAWSGNEEILNILYEADNKIIDIQDSDGATPLSLASEQGHTNIVKKLLGWGASLKPDNSQETPLYKAAISGHDNCLQVLIEYTKSKKTDWTIDYPDLRKSTALLASSFLGNLECFKLLHTAGADIHHIDDEGASALHKAAFNGHIHTMQYILSFNCDINRQDKTGATALHKAAFNGETKAVKLLCGHKANVNIRDDQGGVPLHNAAYGGHKKTVRVLLKYITNPIDVLMRDNNDYNVLHMAASQGHSDIINMLLSKDYTFDINEKAKKYWTPLMLALKQQHYKTAKTLVRNGAEFDFDKEMAKKLRQVPDEKIKRIMSERKQYLKRDKDVLSTSDDIRINLSDKFKANESMRINIKRRDTLDIAVHSNTKKGKKISKEENMFIRSTPDYRRELMRHESLKEKFKQRPKASSFNILNTGPQKSDKFDSIESSTLNVIIAEFLESPANAIETMIEKEIVEDNCSAVARFLFVRDELDKTKLGLFLSEGTEWSNSILDSFVKLFDFTNMEFDMALRRFLVKFKLPGEAQKIDRLIEKFAERYYELNPNIGPFVHQDSVYILAFSVIMLNTDAHNPAIKKRNKMTKAQFLHNNSGTNGGQDFPEKFLSDLYDKIITYEIKMDTDGEFVNAELKGWLTKQGGRIKTWKKRWFVLTDNCLFYFKSNQDKDPCGIIPLENLVVKIMSSKKKFIFELRNSNNGPVKASSRKGNGFVVAHHESYVFQSSGLDEMNLWIDSLNRNIYRDPFYQLLDMKKKKIEGDSGLKPSLSKNE